ncbi:hypothetical protein [Francisella hispaniensis]|uniref:Lipoprotein n=1 Tax=Francisella hispaniensis FSC454 TaxID=1088883 RepID=A0AAC9J491_9GAMM|nr:hypothetical protein [Francisella hispaniensis]APD49869.1 hypothetical protein FSC454_01260 [Francisella hispaniensis FSC454]KYW86340.1 hypothetical protein AUF42_03970 [Francisella hispaniensis FSC454]
MKKLLTCSIVTILLLLTGCINNKNNELDITIDTSNPSIPEFVVPASIPSSQAIAYNFSFANGTCTNPVAGNANGSLNSPAPTSGNTYKADSFIVDNAIFAFSACSSGTIISISFNGGKTLSYRIP